MAIKLKLDIVTKDNTPGAKEEAHFAYIQIYDDATGAILEEKCLPCDGGDIASFKTAAKAFYDKYLAEHAEKADLKTAITQALSDIEKGV